MSIPVTNPHHGGLARTAPQIESRLLSPRLSRHRIGRRTTIAHPHSPRTAVDLIPRIVTVHQRLFGRGVAKVVSEGDSPAGEDAVLGGPSPWLPRDTRCSTGQRQAEGPAIRVRVPSGDCLRLCTCTHKPPRFTFR